MNEISGNKKKTIAVNHNLIASKQKFDSDDSQGSDLSYESSLSSEDDPNLGRIQFFKEEMARFFINYPELINKNLIASQKDLQDSQSRLNKNWEFLAQQILNQAKDSTPSLQSLAKRIALYRYKIEQTDLIDVLLQEKNNIMKQIEMELQQKSEVNIGNPHKVDKRIDSQHEDNNFYSWRKKKEFQFKNNQRIKNTPIENQSKTVQKFYKSLHKSNSQSKTISNTRYASKSKKDQIKKTQNYDKPMVSNNLDDQIMQQMNEKQNPIWKHEINFKATTNMAKQLSDEIKKNAPTNEAGIKKTILNFLSKYKESNNNQFINKCTLSQKIQKLYNDDAKELLIFYPSKINNYQYKGAQSTAQTDQPDKFINLLKQITNGPLIKYWRQMQQNKI